MITRDEAKQQVDEARRLLTEKLVKVGYSLAKNEFGNSYQAESNDDRDARCTIAIGIEYNRNYYSAMVEGIKVIVCTGRRVGYRAEFAAKLNWKKLIGTIALRAEQESCAQKQVRAKTVAEDTAKTLQLSEGIPAITPAGSSRRLVDGTYHVSINIPLTREQTVAVWKALGIDLGK